MIDYTLDEKEIEVYIENFKKMKLNPFKKGDNVKDYIEYLNSVTDNNYVGESGPCA